MQLEGIDHVAMGVRDIERSAKWYIDVLGFQRLHDGMWNGVPTFIGKGNTGIALFPRTRNRKRLHTAKFECFISPFVRTGKISSLRSRN
jgi:Lactoylglutathione lyase and related lyases